MIRSSLISGTRFPLEAQLIHYNSEYASFEEAKGQPGGVAVFASLFQVKKRKT